MHVAVICKHSTALGPPFYIFQFDANNQLVREAAAAELRFQPAEENNVPLRLLFVWISSLIADILFC